MGGGFTLFQTECLSIINHFKTGFPARLAAGARWGMIVKTVCGTIAVSFSLCALHNRFGDDWCTVIAVEIIRCADIWIFSKSNTGGHSKSGNGQNNLFHFSISLFNLCERAWEMRCSDDQEIGTIVYDFNSHKIYNCRKFRTHFSGVKSFYGKKPIYFNILQE